MGQETRVLARGELIARARQPDLDDGGDTAGIGGERHHPVAEIDRLFEIVGDEDDGDAALG